VATRLESVEAISNWLGTDSLGYLSLEGLLSAVQKAKSSSQTFCSACFTSIYPVPIPELLSPKTAPSSTSLLSPQDTPHMTNLNIGFAASLDTPPPFSSCKQDEKREQLFQILTKKESKTPTVTIAYEKEKESEGFEGVFQVNVKRKVREEEESGKEQNKNKKRNQDKIGNSQKLRNGLKLLTNEIF